MTSNVRRTGRARPHGALRQLGTWAQERRTIPAKQRAKGKAYRVAVSLGARMLVHVLYAVLTPEQPFAVAAAYVAAPESPMQVLIGT